MLSPALIALIVVAVVAVGAAIAFAVLFATKGTASATGAISPTQPQVADVNKLVSEGGVLAHMLAAGDVKNMLKDGFVSLFQQSDCAAINRRTCSAWTLIQSELPPMVFVFPVPPIPRIGILIDADKARESNLVVSMGVIDSDTNNRSCCTNESAGAIIWSQPFDATSCIARAAAKQGISAGDRTIYERSVGDPGNACPLLCQDADLNCKIVNSGGSINQFDMIQNWPECENGTFDPCFTFSKVPESSVPENVRATGASTYYTVAFSGTPCPVCSKPFLCVAEPPSERPPGTTNPFTGEDGTRAYVGTDGSDWVNLFAESVVPLGSIAVRQCKFPLSAWDPWVNAMKSFYRKEIEARTTGGVTAELCDPQDQTYLENEVNIYVAPQTSELYGKQNQAFLKCVVGFFYVPSTCVEQLAFLGDAQSLCATYWNTSGNPEYDRFDTQLERENKERSDIAEARSLTAQITDLFNQLNPDNPVVAYAGNVSTNCAPNIQQWQSILNEGISPPALFSAI